MFEFKLRPEKGGFSNGMKILILNWRDIKNPLSGGAEILTHELSKRLVSQGHVVTQFSSMFDGSKEEEEIDGVRIIREGNPDARTLLECVQYKAYKRYKKEFSGKIDIVIDEVHGIPFFTPFYVKEKKVALICEVAGNLWDIAVRFPFNILGKIIERVYPFFYSGIKIITISDSSKKELSQIGFDSSRIFVIPMGSNSTVTEHIPVKEKKETLVFLSRLSKSKGVEDAIKCIALLKNDFPNLILWIIGRGDGSLKKELDKLIRDLRVENNTKFFNYVSEEKKQDLLTRAHILIMPSLKEGWGLTIHEAGARGTPAIVYNVPGLRNTVIDNINGIICKVNTPEELAKNTKKLLKNEELYKKLQMGAISERKKHTWDATVEDFLNFIK